jgi:RNA polymerase sigma-70 factor (ECF subfamily)
MSADEQELVQRAREGDLDAFQQLAQRHQALGYAIAFRMLGQREDAEDVVQESVVVNTALDHRKHERRRPSEPLRVEPAAMGDSEATDLRLSVEAALDRLTPKQRAAFVLRDLQQLPLEEVAAILGCSRITARVHLHNGRSRIRAALESDA